MGTRDTRPGTDGQRMEDDMGPAGRGGRGQRTRSRAGVITGALESANESTFAESLSLKIRGQAPLIAAEVLIAAKQLGQCCRMRTARAPRGWCPGGATSKG